MKKTLITIAMLAAVAVSGFAVMTGCGGSASTPAPSTNSTSTPSVSPSAATYEQVKEKIYTANGAFLASHSEIAARINANINRYGYAAGTTSTYGDMTTIKFSNGDTISVTDTIITVNSSNDSDMSAVLTKACAEVLTASADWDNLYSAISYDLHGMNITYGADGTHHSQVNFDHLRITLVMNSANNYVAYSIQPR